MMKKIAHACIAISLFALSRDACAQQQKFHWSPQNTQEIDIENTLATSPLSNTEKLEIEKIIKRQMRNTFRNDPREKIRDIPGHMRIGFFDLDGDDQKEIVIQSLGTELCGAVGNCFFLALKRTSDGYQPMLAGQAQTFEMRVNEQGQRELILALHDSASEQSLYEYVLCGGKFALAATYDWQDAGWDEAGQFTEFAPPKIWEEKHYMNPCSLLNHGSKR